MAIIRTLKSFLGRKIYPKTVTKAIYDENDNRLDLMLNNGLYNPNILINSDFSYPVNQRGENEYDMSAKVGYTIDRWIAEKATVSVENQYMRISMTAGSDISKFYQFVEFPKKYLGKKLTVSFRYRTPNNGFSAYVRHNNSFLKLLDLSNEGKWHTVSKTFTVLNTDTDFFAPIVFANNVEFDSEEWTLNMNTTASSTSKYIDIAWVKVEVGEYATPLGARTYGEELALCQRYFVKYSEDIARACNVKANSIRFVIPLSTTIRISPRITGGTLIVKTIDGTEQSGFTFSVAKVSYGKMLIVVATKASHEMTDGYLRSEGYTEFDAEIKED